MNVSESNNKSRRLRLLNGQVVTRTKALYYKRQLNECGTILQKNFCQMIILLGENKNSNVLPRGKLPLPIANNFKDVFINKIERLMRGLQNCHILEEFFSIPDFPLKTMCTLAHITIQQATIFMKN